MFLFYEVFNNALSIDEDTPIDRCCDDIRYAFQEDGAELVNLFSNTEYNTMHFLYRRHGDQYGEVIKKDTHLLVALKTDLLYSADIRLLDEVENRLCSYTDYTLSFTSSSRATDMASHNPTLLDYWKEIAFHVHEKREI